LISWIKKDKQSSPSTTSNASSSPFFSLVPAVIEDSGPPVANEAMEIALPGGARLRIASASHIALAFDLPFQRFRKVSTWRLRCDNVGKEQSVVE
jgi:hypothetical protein